MGVVKDEKEEFSENFASLESNPTFSFLWVF
jgi:hypothetical protein